jgi:integrase/recombinase XerD
MNTLRQAVTEYITMRRNLGYKLREAGVALQEFVSFMERRRAPYITQALALLWAQQPRTAQPAHWAQRLNHVRQFARFRSATDSRTEVPAQSLLPFHPKRARPYLYTDQEIRRLLHAALTAPLSPKHRKPCALLPWVYYCLFGLLAVTGMRLGEARHLELRDVDLNAGVLTVRGAKFGKSRLVPLHASTCKILAEYLKRRQRRWLGKAVSSYFFVSSWGNRLDSAQVHRAFYAASRRSGLRGPSDRHGPRLHDLRHRFATNTLIRWYRSEQDPERKLPILSAYLGHVHVSDTQWYLDSAPALMREAMARLERRWTVRS